MFDLRALLLALLFLLGIGALGGSVWLGRKLIIERETCKMGLEAQNKAILEQNIDVNNYVTRLQEQKDTITKKYAHVRAQDSTCEHELKAIKRSLDVFGGEK
ncbi:hypothetical protein [Helicobacter cynogastricus]|uniref:hypothetical protein n=1 Tax=Helicobacter cynogastricus TaxID=329937 RepID=UPI000CF02F24|nr:hypothetical protein [Helicobacter cynogastricus]